LGLTTEEVIEIRNAKDMMINAVSPYGSVCVDWDWKTSDGTIRR